jgi:hypothetical protein
MKPLWSRFKKRKNKKGEGTLKLRALLSIIIVFVIIV